MSCFGCWRHRRTKLLVCASRHTTLPKALAIVLPATQHLIMYTDRPAQDICYGFYRVSITRTCYGVQDKVDNQSHTTCYGIEISASK